MHFRITDVFTTKFPYPRAKYSHFPVEHARLLQISERWRRFGMIPGMLFVLAFTAWFTYFFGWLNTAIYSVLAPGPDWFPQDMPVFMFPALIVSLPLGICFISWTVRFFHGSDYIFIMDLINAREGYDNLASSLWLLRILSVPAMVVFAGMSWCYVHVTDDGFTIKNALTVSGKHYSYDDIRSVNHYKYIIYSNTNGWINTLDHCELYLHNGRRFSDLAPSIDLQQCINDIVAKGHITVIEDSVDREWAK